MLDGAPELATSAVTLSRGAVSARCHLIIGSRPIRERTLALSLFLPDSRKTMMGCERV